MEERGADIAAPQLRDQRGHEGRRGGGAAVSRAPRRSRSWASPTPATRCWSTARWSTGSRRRRWPPRCPRSSRPARPSSARAAASTAEHTAAIRRAVDEFDRRHAAAGAVAPRCRPSPSASVVRLPGRRRAGVDPRLDVRRDRGAGPEPREPARRIAAGGLDLHHRQRRRQPAAPPAGPRQADPLRRQGGGHPPHLQGPEPQRARERGVAARQRGLPQRAGDDGRLPGRAGAGAGPSRCSTSTPSR